MRALVVAVAIGLLAACAETPGGTDHTGVAGSPKPAPSAKVSAGNLTGTWVFGSRNEPPAGPVVACTANQLMTLLDQNGTVSGSVSTCAGPCSPPIENFSGANNKGVVTLNGTFKGNIAKEPTPVDYALTYDPKTQHLVGTRSGSPFWAAPLVQPADGCADIVQ